MLSIPLLRGCQHHVNVFASFLNFLHHGDASYGTLVIKMGKLKYQITSNNVNNTNLKRSCPDLVFVWVVTFTERLVTHLSGNKTHEAGGHYANDGPYLCQDASSEKYKWRRNTLCHTQSVARLNIWGLELSLKMFTLAIHISQTNNTCFVFIFFKHLHNI